MPALVSRLHVAALPASRSLSSWPAAGSCTRGTLHTIQWLDGMLQQLPLELGWWSVISSRAFRARLIIAKVRSEPACHALPPLTTLTDRVARLMSCANCYSQESPSLELYTSCYASIPDGLGGCNLDSRSRRCSGQIAAEACELAVR